MTVVINENEIVPVFEFKVISQYRPDEMAVRNTNTNITLEESSLSAFVNFTDRDLISAEGPKRDIL
jgi:hypothetical protein